MKSQQPVPERGAFSIHNIPFGVFSAGNGKRRCASRIGDYVLDLQKFASEGHLAQIEKAINDSFEAIFSQVRDRDSAVILLLTSLLSLFLTNLLPYPGQSERKSGMS